MRMADVGINSRVEAIRASTSTSGTGHLRHAIHQTYRLEGGTLHLFVNGQPASEGQIKRVGFRFQLAPTAGEKK